MFFFNDTATTEIYPLSLHDALPISETGLPATSSPTSPSTPSSTQPVCPRTPPRSRCCENHLNPPRARRSQDRKSTRLNSSHANISYAVFCLKKKKTYCCYPSS